MNKAMGVCAGAWSCAASGAAGLALVLAPAALAGPEWPEVGDAGPLPLSAQSVVGTGPLSRISGELTGTAPLPGLGLGDVQDMYLIRIADPMNFLATTDGTGGSFAAFNANLFLFTLDGRGLLGNLGFGPAATLTSAATDASGAELVAPGDYYIAISGGFSVPVALPGPIFNFGIPGEVSGPDGPGGFDPILFWGGPTEIGLYRIYLEGAVFIPAPGTVLVFGLAAAAARRRR